MVTAELSQSPSAKAKRSDIVPATYSLSEVAQLWDISYTKANELALSGGLPVAPFRIGRTFRFAKSAVDRQLGLDGHNE